MAIRILHIVGGMNRGGVETWLMHVLRHIDRQRFRMDFLVNATRPCAYDDEIRSLGSRIIPCPGHTRPWRYRRNFLEAIRANGPYDVVHSHVHHFSGMTLRLARAAGVLVRIAHSHNETWRAECRRGPVRWSYLCLMERWIARYATHCLACSEPAAVDLFGTSWRQDPRCRVLHCGIDLTPFRAPVDRDAVRAELGLPADALVVGHVGRFDTPKNHAFLLEVAAHLMKQDSRIWLLLVGDGQLRQAMVAKAAILGIGPRVIFAGSRGDVPRVMRAMDVFVMPSLHEGLPLVLLEAQAAGLPCVVSDAIPVEVDAIAPLVIRLSLSETAGRWAEATRSRLRLGAPALPDSPIVLMSTAQFAIDRSVEELARLYAQRAPTPVRPLDANGAQNVFASSQ